MKSWRSLTGWLRPRSKSSLQDAKAREAPPESSGWSLRFRILVTIIIALMPVAILSVVQGVDRVQRDEKDIRERLFQTARASASDEENMLAAAEQILRALANQPDVRSGSNPDCDKELSDALSGLSFFTNIGRIDAKGEVICSALPQGNKLNVQGLSWWHDAATHDGFVVSEEIYGALSKRNVLLGLLPLRTNEGNFDGALVIGVDTEWLDYMLHAKQLPRDAVVTLFDRSGAVIATNNGKVAESLFSSNVKARRTPSGLFEATGPNDENWLYATAPLLSNQIFAGFAMREADLFVWTYIHVAWDLLLPVFMIALAWAGIWIATDRQVIRWIDYMRRIAAAYAHGHYAIRPALEDAPSEFHLLGNTLSSMADAIRDRDKRLRDAVAQKTLLIKETHHRIKNNLQIVMSLLNLQAGQLRDPAAQDALRQAQARVNALALVHRILHEIEDQSSVDMKRLLNDLVEQLHGGLGGGRRDLRIETDIAERRASSDVAVPITLFTAEALTNVFKHAYPPSHRGGLIRVSLQPIGNKKLRLTVADDGVGLDPAMQKGIGSRLINAFAQQIGGTAELLPRQGGGTAVELVFPDPDATENGNEEEVSTIAPNTARASE